MSLSGGAYAARILATAKLLDEKKKKKKKVQVFTIPGRSPFALRNINRASSSSLATVGHYRSWHTHSSQLQSDPSNRRNALLVHWQPPLLGIINYDIMIPTPEIIETMIPLQAPTLFISLDSLYGRVAAKLNLYYISLRATFITKLGQK